MGSRSVCRSAQSVVFWNCLYGPRAKLTINPLLPQRKDNQSTTYEKHSSVTPGAACSDSSRSTLSEVADLQCERCHGRRSISYHREHSRDPVAFPAVGICSRRKTRCAAAKARLKTSKDLPMIHELPADEIAQEGIHQSAIPKLDSQADLHSTGCKRPLF